MTAEFMQLILLVVGVLLAGIVGYFWRKLEKLEKAMETQATFVDSDKVRSIIKEDQASINKQVNSMREDVKSMAQTMLSAVDKQEARLDSLLMQLLNSGDKK